MNRRKKAFRVQKETKATQPVIKAKKVINNKEAILLSEKACNWHEALFIMADAEKFRCVHRLLWRFCCHFVLNYISSTLILHVTGSLLYSILLLICFILIAKFRKGYFSSNDKGHLTVDGLVYELKNIDINKRSFVIERFVRMDRKKAARKSSDLCESERCVICLDERAEIETLPCKHRVICGHCAWETLKITLQKSTTHTCVVCRCQITDFNGSLFKNLVKLTAQDIRTILNETKAVYIETNKL